MGVHRLFVVYTSHNCFEPTMREMVHTHTHTHEHYLFLFDTLHTAFMQSTLSHLSHTNTHTNITCFCSTLYTLHSCSLHFHTFHTQTHTYTDQFLSDQTFLIRPTEGFSKLH